MKVDGKNNRQILSCQRQNRQSGKNKIHFENMQSQLTNNDCLLSLHSLHTSLILFDKYKQGLASSSAPFKLFDLGSLPRSTDQQSSQEEEKHRVRGPYRKYTYEEKQQAVQCIQNGQDVNLVSKKYGIPRRNLLRWKKNGCQRKEGGGRPTDEEMEKTIYAKVKQGELTDQKQIRKYAVFLSKTQNFKASKGWFVKFCQRYELKFHLASPCQQSQSGADIQSTDSHLN